MEEDYVQVADVPPGSPVPIPQPFVPVQTYKMYDLVKVPREPVTAGSGQRQALLIRSSLTNQTSSPVTFLLSTVPVLTYGLYCFVCQGADHRYLTNTLTLEPGQSESGLLAWYQDAGYGCKIEVLGETDCSEDRAICLRPRERAEVVWREKMISVSK
jgi:hypothetical protein